MAVTSVQNMGTTSGSLHFLGAVLRSAWHFPRSARPLAIRTTVNQIRFTCVQALPHAFLVAVLGGIPVLALAFQQATRFGLTETFTELLVRVLVRELGPLMVAILVVARSATALSAELATNTVLGETETLDSMGVDPLQFYVLPRLVAFVVSIGLLTVFFDAAVLAGGWLVAGHGGNPAVYVEALQRTLTVEDLVWTGVESVVFGVGIVVFSSFEALRVGSRPTEIPVAVSRGIITSILWVLATAALFSVGRTLW